MKFAKMSQATTGCLLFAALSALPAAAQSAPTDRPVAIDRPAPPPEPVAAPTQTVAGTVDSFNRDPRGRINSIVLKTAEGKLDQFNLPPDLGDLAPHISAEGQKATAVGSPERTVGDRTIFRLVTLTSADGKSTVSAPAPGVPEPTQTVEGAVHRLNFSGRGEVDGAILDNGDYIHTGVEAGVELTIGAKVSVKGVVRPMIDGHQAVEADTVNGRAVPHPPVRPEPRPHTKPAPDGPTPPVPPGPEAPAPIPAPPLPPAPQ